jgi:hypothetical protein
MAARSTSSSDYAPNFNDQKLVALDSSDDGLSGIKTEAERSSFLRQLNSSQKEKGLARVAERSSLMGQRNNSQKEKGKAIMSGAGDFDEITGWKSCDYKEFRSRNL